MDRSWSDVSFLSAETLPLLLEGWSWPDVDGSWSDVDGSWPDVDGSWPDVDGPDALLPDVAASRFRNPATLSSALLGTSAVAEWSSPEVDRSCPDVDWPGDDMALSWSDVDETCS